MKKPNFEESLLRLEEIVAAMEDESTTLEAAVALYKEGLKVSAKCKLVLEDIEGEIEILQEEEAL